MAYRPEVAVKTTKKLAAAALTILAAACSQPAAKPTPSATKATPTPSSRTTEPSEPPEDRQPTSLAVPTPAPRKLGNWQVMTWAQMADELGALDDAAVEAHWKRYYDKLQADLEHRVKQLKAKRLEFLIRQKMKERELNRVKRKAKEARQLIARAIAKYKEQMAEDPNRTKLHLLGSRTIAYTKAEAKKALKRWIQEYKRKYALTPIRSKAIALLKTNAERTAEGINSYQNTIQLLLDQIAALKRQPPPSRSVRVTLTALVASGKQLAADEGVPDFLQLRALNETLAPALSDSRIQAKLAEEQKELSAQQKSASRAKTTRRATDTEIEDLEKEVAGL